jgi:Flp pilus assembly protein TadG
MMQKLAVRARRIWRRSDDGATAVEFALIAMVFFWIFFGIIEMGLLMIFNNGIEDGVARAARLIRTGQAKNMGLTAAQFREKICDMVVLKSACRSNLVVDVREYPDFASINPPSPSWDNQGQMQMSSTFQTGSPRRVILVRAFYDWKFITPMIGALAGNTGHGTFLVTAATAFRNEPYAAK